MQQILKRDDPAGVEAFLHRQEWIAKDVHVVRVDRAGEGNMNLVLRVELGGARVERGSVILKQARPWVEKYPDIAAPPERMEVEADFYRLATREPALAARMPELLAADSDQHSALLSDLGPSRDYTPLYAGAQLADADARALLSWLTALHGLAIDPTDWPRLENRSMRALNRTHIFDLPLAVGAPDADGFCPGLGIMAERLRADDRLRARMRELAECYEADGNQLLHGDYYPGSWLATDDGPMVIDPEFGCFGPAEFDIGVFRAHLHFANQTLELARHYQPPANFDARLADAFTGAELIRRLLGVAQLPLEATLEQREAWLEIGRDLVLA